MTKPLTSFKNGNLINTESDDRFYNSFQGTFADDNQVKTFSLSFIFDNNIIITLSPTSGEYFGEGYYHLFRSMGSAIPAIIVNSEKETIGEFIAGIVASERSQAKYTPTAGTIELRYTYKNEKILDIQPSDTIDEPAIAKIINDAIDKKIKNH